jgi:hypothetical protein
MTEEFLDGYQRYLFYMGFNFEQIEFIKKQRAYYTLIREEEYFDIDSYERDMWYTMNQSGLFEDNKDNKSDITDWTPDDTRMFITQV